MKQGRNDQCRCGSGKKYKHCCARPALRAAAPSQPLPVAAVAALAGLAKAKRYAEMEVMATDLLAIQGYAGFAWKALSVARQMQNKDALHALQMAARLLPDDPEAQSNLGAEWRRLGRLEEALSCYRRALECRPEIAEVWNNLGNVQRDLGRPDDAMAAFRRALELKPAFAKPHNGLGNVFQDLGRLEDAAASFQRALELEPRNAEVHTNLGITRRLQNRTSEAEVVCRRALDIDPTHCPALILLAELHSDHGRFQEAEELLRQASAIEPGSPEAWAGIAALRRMTADDADWLAEAERIVGSSLAPRRELPLRYALGKYFDDVGDYDRAFDHYRRANTLAMRGRPSHDRGQVTRGIDRLIQTYDESWMRQPRVRANPSERPLFIVGMPRSGTTLAEQLLASQGTVVGAGELPFWNEALSAHLNSDDSEIDSQRLREFADEYLLTLAELAPEARRVVDKMPGNFLYLGLIHAVLPKAKFIHLRRNPIDTCLSIYFQNFGAVHTYANDLEDLAHYYAEYRRIVAHWLTCLPTGILLEVDYEELVTDPDAVCRRMLAFIGLPWDPNSRNFPGSGRTVSTFSKWQARQSINTRSVARWRHYEAFVAPLRHLDSAPPLAPAHPRSADRGCDVAVDRGCDASAGGGMSAAELLVHARTSHATGRLAEAEEAYRRVLAADAASFEASHNLGILALQTRRPDLAICVLNRAVALNSRHVHANANLGTAYLVANRLQEALEAYRKTLELDPKLAGGWRNQGTILQRLSRHDEAADAFQRCWELDPNFDFALGSMFEARRYACNWSDYQNIQAAIIEGVSAGRNVDRPFSFLSVSDSTLRQLHCAQSHAAYLCPQPLPAVWRGEHYHHTKIRLAYVSADFRSHVVMELMAPVFEAHDRERFQLIGVSLVADDHSQILSRAKKPFDHFIDASGVTDADAARAIREAEADIVVDLTGYTTGCRAAIFAHRPAPVQVSYLGYAGTSGAPYVDYLIADRVTIPAAQEAAYSERVVRLPGCFMPADDPSTVDGPMPSRRDVGLPDVGFVFCAFSNAYKFNPQTFDIWMRLLRETPQSVLWLRDAGSSVRVHLEREAATRQVDPVRLVLAPAVSAKRDHRLRLSHADLFLDTFPYGAHATARDALWAGLPLLTCMGESFASRVAGSLLMSLGLPDLVTDHLDDYATRALALARQPEVLAALRAQLAQSLRDRSRFNVTHLCTQLESAYQTMWNRTQRGDGPAAFTV